MNKKFSTLVAGALLAGAVITPADLFAQVQYANGKTYADVPTTTTAPSTGNNQDYFIVFIDGGKDYVATVKSDGSLEAKEFANAQMTDVINIAFATPNYTITGGSNTMGFATGQLAFGSNITDMTTVTLADGAIVISDGTGYAKLAGTTFSVDQTNSNKIVAKAIAKTSLEVVPATMPVATATDLSASYYVLMDPATGKVLTGVKGAAPVLGAYVPTTQNMFWSVSITDNGNNTGVAKFKNKATGEFLTDASGVHTTVAATKTGDKWGFASYTSVSLTNAPAVLSSINLGAVPADGKTLEAGDLVAITGAGFEASIKKYVDGDKKDKTLANNPFVDVLKPVKFVLASGKPTAKVVAAADNDDAYMLQDADGNIIVVDLDDKYAAGTGTKYAVKTVSPATLANALNATKAEIQNKYAYNFSIKAADDFVAGINQVVNSILVVNKANSTYKLGSVDLSAVPTLAAESTGESFLNAITIRIGKFNKIDVAKLLTKTPSFFTVTNKNTKAVYSTEGNYGKVLGLDADGDADFVKASEALVGYPETQWAVTYDGTDLTFTNRENPAGTAHTISVADLYNTAKTNVFAHVNGDTLEIKPVAKFTEADGFLRLNADDLRDQQYYVGAYSSIFDGVAYWVENHKDNHQVGMDTKKDVATAWNVRTYTYNGTDNLGSVVVSRPDTLLIGSTLGYYDADGKYTTTDDNGDKTVFLKTLAYSFQNNANKEYFAYDVNRYATGEAGKKEGFKDEADADYFAVKMAGDDVYNLVAVDITGGQENLALDADKIYSGDGANKGILNKIGKYSQTENDLFVVEKKDAPEYRKVAMADTIKIYRESSVNEAQVLFEKGEFLSIANAVQFPTINPALYVDTAYVNRGNNNRWEYLLAVEAKHWDSEIKCEIEDHPVHKADTTTGRFLVNLMDSANVYAETHLHDNKFINEEDGEQWAKLGFVEGYHTHDTLYLKRPDGTYNVLPMDRSDYSHSIAKFAFRYVDQEAGSYVIETGRKAYNENGDYAEEVGTGYLKWLNGLVVVVSDIEQAEVFNMNEEEEGMPTANEGVTASEVSVIATDGAVIISGAQGKKVTISNVLGQTVANTVISSDKAEIAAPAGVVVVAVEGEAAVKAIVK